MRLSDLTLLPFDGPDLDLTGLTQDSRKVQPGFLFIAIQGTKADGRTYVAEAIQKGAVALVLPANGAETFAYPPSLAVLKTAHIRRTLTDLASAFYPKQPDTILAVTGTSGKTSTAEFARQLAQACGHKAASLGTLGLVTAQGTSYGSLTTPDPITLHQTLDLCAAQGISHLALEASSHGIEQHRLDHVRLKAACFTNLSRDHLDYHETMAGYFAAKMRLFTALLPSGAGAVLNADIEEYAPLAAIAHQRKLSLISYGTQGTELRLVDVQPHEQGQNLRIEAFGKKIDAFLPVRGGFQAWNALGAAGLLIGAGAPIDSVFAAFPDLAGPPGRMQFIGLSKTGGAVFVDYAHKPDALENVLRAARDSLEKSGGRLGVVFGCGGNRDKGKRPIMGAIAAAQADWALVTDDNPRFEDPATIRAEILAGCVGQTQVREIGDRAQAIAEGIQRLGAKDILIIAGKGHEQGQSVGDKTLPFDDSIEAQKNL